MGLGTIADKTGGDVRCVHAGRARPGRRGSCGRGAFALRLGFCLGLGFLMLVVGAVSAVPSARAETLAQALAAAYASNPRLKAERARLKASDEEVPRAKSGYRPRITGSADAGVEHLNTSPPAPTDGKNEPRGYSIQLTQPLFEGGRTASAVLEAEANVRAARETLRSVEQSVLSDAVTAYMDVIQNRAIVRLREKNVSVLTRELRATRDRFRVGEATRTDVAQARARRAGAVSGLDLAKANLRASRAAFERVIGHLPDGLTEPRPRDDLLPMSLEEALAIAQRENPDVVAAAFRERAARHAVDKVFGEFLPQVNFEAEYRRRYNPSRLTRESETARFTGRVTVPLYQGGEVSARVRQAQRTRESRFQDLENARAKARADTASAWASLVSARAKLQSDRIQVAASRTALAGVRAEYQQGQRTLLDVLDAEQELLDAEVQLTTTRRDLVVASYRVLAAIGRLTAADLGLPVELYDHEVYYRAVRSKWWGVTVTPNPEYGGAVDALKH